MATEKRPGQIEIVFDDEGVNAKGVSLTSHIFVDGEYMKTVGPEHIDGGMHNPVIAQLATMFSTSVVAQLDGAKKKHSQELAALESQLLGVTAERDSWADSNNALAGQIRELQVELETLKNPPVNPRRLPPFTFLALFKDEEVYAALTSTDPIIVVALAKLQTIITYVDLDIADTVNLVGYMEATGLIAPGRGAQILAGEPHE